MKHIFSFFIFCSLSITFTSCKEKTTEAAQDAQKVAEPAGVKFVTDATLARIIWEGKKPTGTHSGMISISEGSIYVNDGMITAGNFIINMNSINTTDLQGDEKTSLDEHLKGTGSDGAKDFFNVKEFPTAKFEISEIIGTSEQPNSNATVSGNLTMLGITKGISFAANIGITPDNIVVNTNPFTINRTDWGIKYGSSTFFSDLADKVIDDNITLQISLSGILAPKAQ